MSFFGLIISQPLLLAAFIPASGIALLAYRKRKNTKQVVVNSLFLLQQFKSQLTRRKAPKPPLRYLWEFILFVLLAIILSDPKLEGSTAKTAILLDDSMSMAAIHAGSTLFQNARKEILSEISLQPENFDLYTTSSGLLSEHNPPANFSYSQDDIPGALEKIFRTGIYEDVIVYTDKTPTDQIPKQFSYVQIRPSVDLENLSIAAASYSSEDSLISVKMKSFAKREVVANVLIHNWALEPIASQEVTISPFAEKEVSLAVPSLKEGAKISLDPKDFVDALPNDNYFFVAPTSIEKVIGVHSTLDFEKLALKPFPRLKFEAAQKQKTYDGLIFHYAAVSQLPDKPSIFLNSNPPNIPSSLTEKPSLAYLLEPGHEIARYLNFRLLTESKYYSYNLPANSISIAKSDNGTILGALIDKTTRYSFCGIEVLPYSGKESAFSSVLLLNLLKWTFLDDSPIEALSGIEVIAAKKGWSFLSESSSPRVLEEGELIKEPGLIKADNTLRSLNFFDEEESNLLKTQTFKAPSRDTSPSESGKTFQKDLLAGLLMGFSAILVLDLILFYFVL